MDAPGKNKRQECPETEADDLSTHTHRQTIGFIGSALPLILWLIAGWRDVSDINPWQLQTSISAYYYTGAVAIFSGMFFALGLFLLTYRGYDNQFYRFDRLVAGLGGAAAVLLALFPTFPPSDPLKPVWWNPAIGKFHIACAGALLGSLAIFSLFLFPLYDKTRPITDDKKQRNRIYRVCGVIIVACIAWILYDMVQNTPIFWPETVALEAFAISWLTKGRIDLSADCARKNAVNTAQAAGKMTLNYARGSGKVLKKAWKAIRSPQKTGPTAPQNSA